MHESFTHKSEQLIHGLNYQQNYNVSNNLCLDLYLSNWHHKFGLFTVVLRVDLHCSTSFVDHIQPGRSRKSKHY